MRLAWLLLALFLVLAILQEAQTIHLRIDPDQVQNYQRGNVLDIHLGLPAELAVDAAAINECHVCILQNATRCACFEESLSRLTLTLPESCQGAQESYWFALNLHKCPNAKEYVTSAQYVMSKREQTSGLSQENKLSFILPLTLDDLSRATILFESLRQIESDIVYEMLVFVPSGQLQILDTVLRSLSNPLTFPVRILDENVLFRQSTIGQQPRPHGYAIQMAIKLLAAKMLKTTFYLTLDADVVLLRPLQYRMLVSDNNLKDFQRQPRALYKHESRLEKHPHWWEGSERMIGISPSPSIDISSQGFSVTPAVLSTHGSLLVISALENAMYDVMMHIHAHRDRLLFQIDDYLDWDYGIWVQLQSRRSLLSRRENTCISSDVDEGRTCRHDNVDGNNAGDYKQLENESRDDGLIEKMWIGGFGRGGKLWSEYTLYRVVLDHFNVFPTSHVREDSIKPTHQSDGSLVASRIHCNDVWFAEQLPWDLKISMPMGECDKYADVQHAAIGEDAWHCECAFSVVQSTTGVNPSDVFAQTRRLSNTATL